MKKINKIIFLAFLFSLHFSCRTLIYIPQYNPTIMQSANDIPVVNELKYRDDYVRMLINVLTKMGKVKNVSNSIFKSDLYQKPLTFNLFDFIKEKSNAIRLKK